MSDVTKYQRPNQSAIHTRELDPLRHSMAGHIITAALEFENTYDAHAISARHHRTAKDLAMGHRYVEARMGDGRDFNQPVLRGVAHVAPAIRLGPLSRLPMVARHSGLSVRESGFAYPLWDDDQDVAAALLYSSTAHTAELSRIHEGGGLNMLTELAEVDFPDTATVGSLRAALVIRRPWLLEGEPSA